MTFSRKSGSTSQITTPNGTSVKQDTSGNLGVFRSGTEDIADVGGDITILQTNKLIQRSGGLGSTILFRLGGAGTIISYNSIGTAGLGVSAIYAAGAQTLYTNVAPTLLTYTPPATAGVYRLSAYLNILTGGTLTFKVKVTYKDPGGNAVTDIPDFEQQNSATLLPGGPTANTTGRFSFEWVIAIDNSATAITIADNAGTYTAGTYYWTPILEQLA